jgi:transposase-like protein
MAQQNIGRMVPSLEELFGTQDGLRHFLETVIQEAMAIEVQEHLDADRHERTENRVGYRNGSKPRRFKTRAGELSLSIPQVRSCEPYHPGLFARWQRSERALLVACAEMYYQGVSTRNVQSVLQEMCGLEVSAMTVSRVAAELDEKLAEFRSRRLDTTSWPYLMIDARYEKVRVEGKVVSQAVLVVVGFTALGRREILDWRVGDSESEQCWGAVFSGLKDRGLKGVKLVVSDAHAGIRAALSRHFQGCQWQRCRVHFKRELMRKVSYKRCGELMKDLAAVFASEEKTECRLRGQEMAVKWQGISPAAAKMLEEGLEDTLTVLDFPEYHRKRLASTNFLENLMRRLKKRTKVVGIFPNRASCDRLIGAQLLEVHDTWQTESAGYFNMEQYAEA